MQPTLQSEYVESDTTICSTGSALIRCMIKNTHIPNAIIIYVSIDKIGPYFNIDRPVR